MEKTSSRQSHREIEGIRELDGEESKNYLTSL